MGKNYTQEFKEQIAALYEEGNKSFDGLAREFGLSPTSVSAWVRKAREERGEPADGGLTESERQELIELRRKTKQQQAELEILGKAVAFFARRLES